MLKKLHLKKQLEENPVLSRYGREETSQFLQERESAKPLRRSLDVSTKGSLIGRVRNRRGEYEEISPDCRDRSSQVA